MRENQAHTDACGRQQAEDPGGVDNHGSERERDDDQLAAQQERLIALRGVVVDRQACDDELAGVEHEGDHREDGDAGSEAPSGEHDAADEEQRDHRQRDEELEANIGGLDRGRRRIGHDRGSFPGILSPLPVPSHGGKERAGAARASGVRRRRPVGWRRGADSGSGYDRPVG
jgi:hypothetical protein